MQSLKVGDTIRCQDANDELNVMEELAKSGIDADFAFHLNAATSESFFLEVTDIDADTTSYADEKACRYCKHYMQGDCNNPIVYKMLHERHEVGYLAAVSFTPDEDFFCKFWE